MARSYSEDEKQVLRQGRALRDLLDTEAWKVYCEILQAHVDDAATQALKPLYDQTLVGGGAETMSRIDGIAAMARAEHAKGRFGALQLAMTLPAATVAQMDQIVASAGNSEEDE